MALFNLLFNRETRLKDILIYLYVGLFLSALAFYCASSLYSQCRFYFIHTVTPDKVVTKDSISYLHKLAQDDYERVTEYTIISKNNGSFSGLRGMEGEALRAGSDVFIIKNKEFNYKIVSQIPNPSLLSFAFGSQFGNGYLILLMLILLTFVFIEAFKSVITILISLKEKALVGIQMEQTKVEKVMVYIKGFLPFGFLMAFTYAILLVLVKGIVSVEHSNSTLLGAALCLSLYIILFSPQLCFNAMEYVKSSKKQTIRNVKSIIATSCSCYALWKVISFVYTANFTATKDIASLLKDFLKFFFT